MWRVLSSEGCVWGMPVILFSSTYCDSPPLASFVSVTVGVAGCLRERSDVYSFGVILLQVRKLVIFVEVFLVNPHFNQRNCRHEALQCIVVVIDLVLMLN